jgi:hypothetical protein
MQFIKIFINKLIFNRPGFQPGAKGLKEAK